MNPAGPEPTSQSISLLLERLAVLQDIPQQLLKAETQIVKQVAHLRRITPKVRNESVFISGCNFGMVGEQTKDVMDQCPVQQFRTSWHQYP